MHGGNHAMYGGGFGKRTATSLLPTALIRRCHLGDPNLNFANLKYQVCTYFYKRAISFEEISLIENQEL